MDPLLFQLAYARSLSYLVSVTVSLFPELEAVEPVVETEAAWATPAERKVRTAAAPMMRRRGIDRTETVM